MQTYENISEPSSAELKVPLSSILVASVSAKLSHQRCDRLWHSTEPINYFIENCIEYKIGKKIYFDDMYQVFIDFSSFFYNKEIIETITMKQLIDYFTDNSYKVKYNMLHEYKFKYDIYETIDEQNELFDTINNDKEMNMLKLKIKIYYI